MTLPFLLGENSANEAVNVDFEQLPHLFVSYSEEEQIRQFIYSLFSSLKMNPEGHQVDFALALSGSLQAQKLFFPDHCSFKYCFVPGDEFMSNTLSRDKFMQALAREMRERSAILHKEGKPGKRKHVPHMVILLHDVFHIILSHKKSISGIFLQLLLMGKSLKMHVVASSCSTYRMLLKQLVHMNPSVMKKFRKHHEEPLFGIVTPLGAELVITAEDFIFFKQANALDYQRLYPLSQHRNNHKTINGMASSYQ